MRQWITAESLGCHQNRLLLLWTCSDPPLQGPRSKAEWLRRSCREGVHNELKRPPWECEEALESGKPAACSPPGFSRSACPPCNHKQEQVYANKQEQLYPCVF